jgi:heptosyltransferase-2
VFDLLGDEKDIDICHYIISNLSKKIQIIDNSGKTSILESVRIIDRSDLLISNDTGLLHIASARNVPIVAIYGSTVPSFGFMPYKVPHCICDIKLRCRPCTHIGKKDCPKKHFNCMKLLSPDIVFRKMEDFILNK